MGFHGKFEHAAMQSVYIKKESQLVGYMACEDAAGGNRLFSQPAEIIKLIILMPDCNLEISK